MLLTMVFFGGFFLGSVKRPYVQLSSPGQTEGLKGGFKEWVDGWIPIYILSACRQVVAYALKVIIACLRQGFCIRKTK